MRRFLLEAFEPASATSSAAQLRQAAEQLAREGTHVVYRRTIRVAEDETSFHLLDAADEAAVAAAAGRAGIQPVRIVVAEESAAG